MNKKTDRLHSSQKNAMLRTRNREQIRSYFEQVLNLRNSGEPFPVDLDDVWPLVYSRKDKAVDVLDCEFIEGKEYVIQSADNQVFPQNGENLELRKHTDNQRFRQKAESYMGGRPLKRYYLSVDCMQYLIARKDKTIFDVYQQVFYLAMDASMPIAGVMPILYQGKIYYPYGQLLKSVGCSVRSGSVAHRKRQYPQCFIKEFGANFITPDFARMLVKQRELHLLQQEIKPKQLELPF